jgi:hypothetical protein
MPGWPVYDGQMRAHWVVVILASVVVSGCIPTDACDANGQSNHNELVNAAPGAVLTLALAGCSTCAHSHVSGYWTKTSTDLNTTGYVEIQLFPRCFVRDITVMANPGDGEGIADGNVKNCGDVVDYDGYVTNRTNVTLDKMEITMVCPTAN